MIERDKAHPIDEKPIGVILLNQLGFNNFQGHLPQQGIGGLSEGEVVGNADDGLFFIGVDDAVPIDVGLVEHVALVALRVELGGLDVGIDGLEGLVLEILELFEFML